MTTFCFLDKKEKILKDENCITAATICVICVNTCDCMQGSGGADAVRYHI